MSDIEWAEDGQLQKRNMKYGPLLKTIKGEQLASSRHRGMWARIAEFANDASARDTAYRLVKAHDEFDFVSRKDGNVTAVYARLKEGVTA